MAPHKVKVDKNLVALIVKGTLFGVSVALPREFCLQITDVSITNNMTKVSEVK